MFTGSCLCGEVAYIVELSNPGTSLKTSICHCRPCRKITGATTSLNLTVPASNFSLSKGTLKTVRVKHCDEGFDFELSFCGDCGSPIYADPLWDTGTPIVVIQAGTIDNEDMLVTVPSVELNISKRLPWVAQVDGAEQREKYTPSAPAT